MFQKKTLECFPDPGLILSSDSENDCNSPNGPKVPPSSQVDEINLVDICANREIFEAFAKEWSKRESFSIGNFRILNFYQPLNMEKIHCYKLSDTVFTF